jgi:DNA repair photolyase
VSSVARILRAIEEEGNWYQMKSVSQPTINEDGVSIKGCSIIYAPSGQAGEYARLAANPYKGCGHSCSYCYVPSVIQISRAEFDKGANEKKDYLRRLRNDAEKYRAANITEQVLLCFTTDPYHPGNTDLTRQTIEVLKEYGLAFCTLTKGGSRALRDKDLFRPDRDAFAASLTSLDDSVSLQWEPKAALPGDRIETLKRFYEGGIYTWVSLEPVYDTAATLEIISQTHQFVNLYKVGRLNYHRLTRSINWRDFTLQVAALLQELGKDSYIKKDLQVYLPEIYSNVKHRPQSRA